MYIYMIKPVELMYALQTDIWHKNQDRSQTQKYV